MRAPRRVAMGVYRGAGGGQQGLSTAWHGAGMAMRTGAHSSAELFPSAPGAMTEVVSCSQLQHVGSSEKLQLYFCTCQAVSKNTPHRSMTMQGLAQPVAPSHHTAPWNWERGGTVRPLKRSCAKQRELRDQRETARDSPARAVSEGRWQGRALEAGRRQAGARCQLETAGHERYLTALAVGP